MTVSLREGVVKSCANQCSEHCQNNGGTIKCGFLKDLVQQAKEKIGGHLDTKYDDIKNAIKRINKEKKKIEDQQSQQVSPTDSSNSSSSPTEISGSSILADDISQLHQLSNTAHPNECLWQNCSMCAQSVRVLSIACANTKARQTMDGIIARAFYTAADVTLTLTLIPPF